MPRGSARQDELQQCVLLVRDELQQGVACSIPICVGVRHSLGSWAELPHMGSNWFPTEAFKLGLAAAAAARAAANAPAPAAAKTPASSKAPAPANTAAPANASRGRTQGLACAFWLCLNQRGSHHPGQKPCSFRSPPLRAFVDQLSGGGSSASFLQLDLELHPAALLMASRRGVA